MDSVRPLVMWFVRLTHVEGAATFCKLVWPEIKTKKKDGYHERTGNSVSRDGRASGNGRGVPDARGAITLAKRMQLGWPKPGVPASHQSSAAHAT